MAENDGGAVKGKIGGGKFHLKGDMSGHKAEAGGAPGDHLKHHKTHHKEHQGKMKAHHKNRMHMKAHGK